MHINLIGDSQAVRLHKFILEGHSKFEVDEVVAKSGLTITELKSMVKRIRPVFKPNSVTLLLIATNDIKLRRSYSQITKDLVSLVRIIRKFIHKNSTLIITKLPFFPKYRHSPHILQLIDRVNKFIASLVNSHTRFLDWEFSLDLDAYFHQHYFRSRRPDQLHLNNQGFSLLLDLLDRVITVYNSSCISLGI